MDVVNWVAIFFFGAATELVANRISEAFRHRKRWAYIRMTGIFNLVLNLSVVIISTDSSAVIPDVAGALFGAWLGSRAWQQEEQT